MALTPALSCLPTNLLASLPPHYRSLLTFIVCLFSDSLNLISYDGLVENSPCCGSSSVCIPMLIKSQTLPTDQSPSLWLLSLISKFIQLTHASLSAFNNTHASKTLTLSTNCELFQIRRDTKPFMYTCVFSCTHARECTAFFFF